jgi:mannosyltransferase
MGEIVAKTKLIWPILILALGLRLINLNQSFWLDEASQAQMSSLSVSRIWSGRSADFHPPLFYLLSHYWLQLGHSEIWLRLPSVVFGVLTVFVVYKITGEILPDSAVVLKNKKITASQIAAFLTAIAPFLIYYSQEFRSYSLLCLLGTLSMYLFYKKQYLWLAVINSLMLYTHYSGIFLLVAEISYWLFYLRKQNVKFIAHLLLTALFCLPWLPQFLSQLHAGINIDTYMPGWRQVLSISSARAFPVIIFKLVAGRINFLSRIIYGLYIIFVFAVTFLAIFIARKQRRFLSHWLLVPIITLIIFSLALPQNQPFRVIYVLPALLIIFTQACLRFPKLFLTLLIYISLVGNVTYFTRPRLQREQWRQAITFLSQNSGPQTQVVVEFSDKLSPFYWYAPQLSVLPAIPVYPAQPQQVTSALTSLIGKQKVWLVTYLSEITDPNQEADLTIRNLGFIPTTTYNFEGVGFIQEYENRH